MGECWREGGYRAERDKGEKNGATVIINKIYLKKTIDKKHEVFLKIKYAINPRGIKE